MIAAAQPNPLDFQAVWEAYSGTLLGWALNVAAAAAILVFGLWIAGTIRGFIRRRIDKSRRVDSTLASFLASLVYYAVVVMVLVAVLNRFGVQTTSLVAVLGAATLAIGLALQGTLSNVAAGVMIVLLRPYRVGDHVEIGVHGGGTVRDITLFTTELSTADNVQIVLPNGLCWGAQPIRNFSTHRLRRCDLTFFVPGGDGLDQAMETVLDVARAEKRVLESPEPPWVGVANLLPANVAELQLRAWVDKRDYADVRFALVKAVKDAFDAAGAAIRTK